MADNIHVNPGTAAGKLQVATDDIGGVHFPIYKQAFGADGAQTPVSGSDPLPVLTVLAEKTYMQQEAILEATENLEVQLKIMNVHLQAMTGEKITKEDV